LRKRFVVKASPIHGRGVFATSELRRYEYIAKFGGTRTTENGIHVLWVIDEEGNEMGIRGNTGLRYLNHSSRPNAEFRGAELYALRNIRPGQEITLHYGDDWDEFD